MTNPIMLYSSLAMFGEKPFVSIVVPVYNEERNIIPFTTEVLRVFSEAKIENYEIIFSMDPSSDRTEDIILKLAHTNKNIKLLKLSRKFGQPAATLAGINYSSGDVCIIIDVDLQDPPTLIPDMIKKWKEGFDVVYAQRISRKGETFLKRLVAYLGYWLINKISDVDIPRNVGDFRLISRRIVETLKNMQEHEGFLRGLVGYIGFKQTTITYDRQKRFMGKGKYNKFWGSITIGLNGVIGFSKYPLHLISLLGIIISIFSFLLSIIYLFLKLINYDVKWGNPTLVILISFIGGIQLLSIGVVGEYMARIFDAIKKRPLYIIDSMVGFD